MNITITSSNSTVISQVVTASIQVGKDYAALPLSAKVPGTTTLTFSAPGLSTASLAITFLSYPSTDTITGGPATIFTNQTSIISVSAQLDGSPLVGTPVDWKVASGGLVIITHHASSSSSSTTSSTSTTTVSTTKSTSSTTSVAKPAGVQAINDTTDTKGGSAAIFYPTKAGSVLITVVIAPGSLLAHTLNFTVLVSAPPPTAIVTKAKPSIIQAAHVLPTAIGPVGGAGGAVGAVFLIRKRKGGAKGDEEFDTSFE